MRSEGTSNDNIKSRVAFEGTITWSANENRNGQNRCLTLRFHALPLREAIEEASEPNRKAVPASRLAKNAIQNDAHR